MATDTQSPTTQTDAPASVDRRFRVSSDLYRGLIAEGLIAPDEVGLADGRLVRASSDDRLDPSDRLYRMPLDVYHRAAEAELLGPADRVVLLDGLLVETMTRNPSHVAATLLAQEALSRVMPPGFRVVHEVPLTLSGGLSGRDSEPEPDLMVVRGDIRDFTARHPGPAEVALVVEVSRTSHRKDREALARYALAGIPTAWVVDLNGRTVEVHYSPAGEAGYRESAVYREGGAVPVVVNGLDVGRVAVADLPP